MTAAHEELINIIKGFDQKQLAHFSKALNHIADMNDWQLVFITTFLDKICGEDE